MELLIGIVLCMNIFQMIWYVRLIRLILVIIHIYVLVNKLVEYIVYIIQSILFTQYIWFWHIFPISLIISHDIILSVRNSPSSPHCAITSYIEGKKSIYSLFWGHWKFLLNAHKPTHHKAPNPHVGHYTRNCTAIRASRSPWASHHIPHSPMSV